MSKENLIKLSQTVESLNNEATKELNDDELQSLAGGITHSMAGHEPESFRKKPVGFYEGWPWK